MAQPGKNILILCSSTSAGQSKSHGQTTITKERKYTSIQMGGSENSYGICQVENWQQKCNLLFSISRSQFLHAFHTQNTYT